MKTRFSLAYLFGLVLASLALTFPTVARANEQVYEKLLPSAVFIQTKKCTGSGAIVDAQKKWVLTNYHVVGDEETALVAFPFKATGGSTAHGCKSETGRVIYREKARDLAVIELSNLPAEAKQVPLAAVSAKPGQTVHLIGNPGLLPGKLALWVYSYGKARQVEHHTIPTGSPASPYLLNCQVLLTTLPSNQGDSGGPIVNDNGDLVGIVQGAFIGKNSLQISIDISEIHAALAKAGSNVQPR